MRQYKPAKREDPRFLMVPELRNAERWKYMGIVDHPMFRHGPFYAWQSRHGQVWINRQLFRIMMTGTMEMEKHG